MNLKMYIKSHKKH